VLILSIASAFEVCNSSKSLTAAAMAAAAIKRCGTEPKTFNKPLATLPVELTKKSLAELAN
jgi:hypothetical protein